MAETTIYTIPPAETTLIAAEIRNTGWLKKRWLYHPLFWLLYYSLTIVLYLGLRETLHQATYIMTFVMVLCEAAFCYLNLYLLIPRLLFARKYAWYALALLATLLVCPLSFMALDLVYSILIEHRDDARKIFNRGQYIVATIQSVYTMGLATGAKFVKDTFINQQHQKEREKHYLETELKFLRSQIQPHFFFNTLNNIYSLTLKKSDLAPEIVLKLSDLMSYMLYDSTAPRVPLTKEIDYLHNYLDVEQLRFGSRLTITFTIKGPTTAVEIPPMILILFLENSFKHGVKNNISHILLTIDLEVAGNYLHFRVENPVPDEEKDPDNKGIGLKNVRRRLDLLYGKTYTLDIREENNIFIVSLKMPLCWKDLHYMIVDDEPLAIDVIENYLQRLDATAITRCGNAVEAFQLLQRSPVDCIFLDIEMPLLSGLELLKTIKDPPAIIITTAYRDYAVEGFELEVIDYLVKPISFPRFMKALEKVGKHSRTLPHKDEETPAPGKDHPLFLKVDKKFIKVLIGDILYIESLKDYVRVRTRDASLITYQSLTEITEKLPSDQFARVHRSFTIALGRVNGIDGNCVDIDGKLIPVSRENRQDLFRKLHK